MSDDITPTTSSVSLPMADPEDQEMISDQIPPEKDLVEMSGHQHDSEGALKAFLQLAIQEHITKYQRSQPSNFLESFFSENWDKLGSEYQKSLYPKIEIAERKHFEPLPPPSADLGPLERRIEGLRAENEDLKEDARRNGEAILAKESSFKRLDKEQKALQSKLTAKTVKLDNSKKTIARLQQDLSSKNQTLGKMHAFVVESGQQTDPYDDRYFTEKFKTLRNDIQHLVKKYFPATLDRSSWKEYDNVSKDDDRDFFLQAKFATVLAQTLLSHDRPIFGLGGAEERNLAAFEQLLQGNQVPPSEIVSWRIQTIKAAAIMKGNNRRNPGWEIIRELRDKLKDVHKQVSHLTDWPGAEKAISALMDSAYDLAVALRSCRVEYEWHQTVPPTSLEPTDVERIDEYDVRSRPTGKPVKILFGPVYKRVDGKPEVLQQGIVLYG